MRPCHPGQPLGDKLWLHPIEGGDAKAAENLLPLVYEALRRLAAQRLAYEKPGQTLQATALVHEAYIRLVGKQCRDWNGRAHLFGAAARAMGAAATLAGAEAR